MRGIALWIGPTNDLFAVADAISVRVRVLGVRPIDRLVLIGQTIRVGICPRMSAIRSGRRRVVRISPSGSFVGIGEPVAIAVRCSSGDRQDIELEVGARGARADPEPSSVRVKCISTQGWPRLRPGEEGRSR